MRKAVFDSWALIAFFKGEEPAATDVDRRINTALKSGESVPISLINWGEILYQFERIGGKAAATAVESDIDQLPIEIIPPDRQIAKAAASLKSKGGLSYADCFAAALAKSQKAELWTGDPELLRLEGLKTRPLSRH